MARQNIQFLRFASYAAMVTANPRIGSICFVHGNDTTPGSPENDYTATENAIYVCTGVNQFEPYSGQGVASLSFSDSTVGTPGGGILTVTFDDGSTQTITGIASEGDLSALAAAFAADLNEKADKVTSATADNLVSLTNDGNIADSGISKENVNDAFNAVAVSQATNDASITFTQIDAGTEVVKLVAGDNVTLTANAGNKTIQIDAKGDVTDIAGGNGISATEGTGEHAGEFTVTADLTANGGLKFVGDTEGSKTISVDYVDTIAESGSTTNGKIASEAAVRDAIDNLTATSDTSIVTVGTQTATETAPWTQSYTFSKIDETSGIISKGDDDQTLYITTATSSANPLVTKSDIAGIAGGMHFRGVVDQPSEISNPANGDFVVISSTPATGYNAGQEYVYVTEGSPATGRWEVIGDQNNVVTSFDGAKGAITIADTNSVDLTVTGNELKADVKVVNNGGIIISNTEGSTGLALDGAVVTKIDNAFVDASLSNGTITFTQNDSTTDKTVSGLATSISLAGTVGSPIPQPVAINPTNGVITINTMSAYNADNNPIATQADVTGATLMWEEWA